MIYVGRFQKSSSKSGYTPNPGNLDFWLWENAHGDMPFVRLNRTIEDRDQTSAGFVEICLIG